MCERVPRWDLSYAPLEDHPFDARSEPSALGGWLLRFLHCDPKEISEFLRILFTEGQGVRLWWAFSEPKGTTGTAIREESDGFHRCVRCSPFHTVVYETILTGLAAQVAT